ncbi:MAG: MFS transporter [Caldilineaceae bacterium]|nr:MFS transporter [Caldilineaceae bacterium]
MTPRFFYGWWIVAAAVLLQFTFLSVSQSTVSVFLRPVVAEMGWQVWQFTLGSSLSVLASALSGAVVGRIVDQRGPRILVLGGAVVAAICLFGLGRQANLWLFWLLHMSAGFIGWTLFGPLVVNTTINKWFVRRRGWALAIGSSGISLGGLIAPVAMTVVVDTLGWRNGYYVQALFVLAIVAPVALLMRRTPEDAGLRPDGGPLPGEGGVTSPDESEPRSLTSRLALRTPGFWLLLLGYSMNQAALASVLTHAVPFATDASFSRRTASLALAVNGLGNLLSKAVWGYCLQRFPPRCLAVAAFTSGGGGVALMLLAASTGELALLFAGFFLYGFGFGGTIPISESLWVSYFGRAHIGAVRGIAQPLTVIGPTIAPVLVGAAYDLQGSYHLAFLGIIGVYMLAGLLVAVSRPPGVQSTQ